MKPDTLAITKRYYAQWLDVDPAILDESGVVAVPSSRREVRQAGYAHPFAVYCFVSGETRIVSYHRCLTDCVGEMVRIFEAHSEMREVVSGLASLFGVQPGHALKYRFVQLPGDLDTIAVRRPARRLTRDDYDDFLAFHRAQYPNGNQEKWLAGYFNEIADKGYVYGVYAEGRLVSATDVPDVPYMADVVLEPGINTLPGYRRRGYARAVVGVLLAQVTGEGKVPLWSCRSDNVGSQRLAESLGYVRFADVITVSM